LFCQGYAICKDIYKAIVFSYVWCWKVTLQDQIDKGY
jgi:hypothetical protein